MIVGDKMKRRKNWGFRSVCVPLIMMNITLYKLSIINRGEKQGTVTYTRQLHKLLASEQIHISV